MGVGVGVGERVRAIESSCVLARHAAKGVSRSEDVVVRVKGLKEGGTDE